MDTLDQILENLWSSDYVQKNPNKAYKAQYAAEYNAIAKYMTDGTRPDPANYSKMGKVLVGLEDQVRAVTPPPDPTPVTAFDIPRWTQYLDAGTGVGTNQRIGWWRQYKTPNNSLIDSGSGEMVPHLCTPAPNPRNPTGPKSWEWWCLGSITIPTNWPVGTGKSFATINPHNSSYDVGNTGHGGIGWAFGGGVSPWHIFYREGQAAPDMDNDFQFYIDPSPTTNYPLIPVERGHRYDFTVRCIFGRNDKELGLAGPGNPGGGIGNHPNGGLGHAWVWVDGVLKVDTGNRDTLKRGTNPDDGKVYTQTCMHRYWDGAYVVGGLNNQITMERTASRVGRTLAEALEDGKDGFALHSEFGEGGGKMVNLSPFKSTDFKAPIL